jgi:eukaryotic-like serine/threonine-protein kinase
MELAAGTRIGVYEITGPLGSGGMGEVYRAADTSLKRDVAIKILPPSFAADVDRVARFQREAETLAALNHPNIAQIHGLERSGDSTALIMELVEGRTLAEHLALGSLPVEEALKIAMQIADALAAAHERGIVHRDLKPGNVKLTPGGVVKVLDFGIATPPRSAISTSDRHSPTRLTPALTEAGVLLGTAAYMSPEQARGKAVDQRADIWAFGCVLYEMLTGQPVFEAEDVTTTLARVLEREPRLEALAANVPRGARLAIALCLKKDLQARIADIRDVKLALAGALETDPSAPGPSPPRRRAIVWGGIAAAIAAIVGGGATWAWIKPIAETPRGVTRLTIPTDGRYALAAISKDGSQLSFFSLSGPSQPFIRRLDEFEARPLGGAAEAARYPCFSPDGRWLATPDLNGTQMKKVELSSGATLPLATGLVNAATCDWADDGHIYFGGRSGVRRVPETGGEVELVVAGEKASDAFYGFPHLLPGSKALLFTDTSDLGNVRIALQNLSTGDRKTLLQNAGAGYFVSSGARTGYLVYGQKNTLFASRFDLERLEAGAPQPVLAGVGGVGPIVLANVSESGTLVYVPDVAPSSRLTWVGRDGTEAAIAAPSRNYADPALSPDGRRVACELFESGSLLSDIYVYALDSGRLTRLTFGGFNSDPVWTPDGARIVYAYAEDFVGRNSELRSVPADGSAPPVTHARLSSAGAPKSISRDGHRLVGVRAGGNQDIWVAELPDSLSADTPIELTGLIESPFRDASPSLSADGRWLAYSSEEGGRAEVYVVPYPGPGGKFQISTDGGDLPQWNADGDELFYVNGTRLMAVKVETSPAFRALVPRVLFDAPDSLGDALLAHHYSYASQEDRFLLLKTDSTTPTTDRLQVVVNWVEELKRLVPNTVTKDKR